MKKILTLFVFVLVINVVRSQTVVTDTAGYTSADASAVLDVRSTTKGLLLPRLTATQRSGMASPANGLIVYQSSGSTGLYLRNNGSWEKLGTYSLPSLTSGSVLFSDGTTISQDNSNFYWDNTNKRLGIGTSPNYRLHAVLSSSGAENWLSYFNVSGGTTDNRAVTGYAHGTTTNYGIFGQAGHASEGSGSYNYGTYGFAYGTSSSTENFGVYGNTTGVGTYNFGVNGKSTGAASGAKYNYGVNGYAGGATGAGANNIGVYGESIGIATGSGSNNIGVSGRAGYQLDFINSGRTFYGVFAGAYGGSYDSSTQYTTNSYNYGVFGYASALNGSCSTNYALFGYATGTATTNYGVFSSASGATTNYSFYGAAGTFYNASSGSFGGNLTVPTLNTGQGNNELYAMDQNVTTSSNVSFANISGTGISLPVASKTSNYTITSSDYSIVADASSGSINITLPDASGISGRIYVIKRLNSGANAVTVLTTNSQTIDGLSSYSLSAQFATVMVQSDGSNWIILSKF
ncbi:MAG TPA: hypothetical protein P5050_11305 [Bacteroidia bacterium]|nr:hypothetical protein [Bacteroidia bacterium]HRS59792.1 hypothetical protein [Bacteroidia bacterium]HRU68510.1 hypothetical protein [Bacteroidia bacterium]